MIVFAWLVQQGLWHDLVSAFVLVPIMHLLNFKPLNKIRKATERMDQRDRDRALQANAPSWDKTP